MCRYNHMAKGHLIGRNPHGHKTAHGRNASLGLNTNSHHGVRKLGTEKRDTGIVRVSPHTPFGKVKKTRTLLGPTGD